MSGLKRVLCAIATMAAVAFMSNVAALAGEAAAPASPPNTPETPAEITPDPSPWQDVITGQIEAFRKGDGKTALGYAGAAFQKTFADPDTFMISIAASGYGPIFTSVSHSFGRFTQPDANSVVQVVELIGPRQESYEAIYALGKEAGGWRVEGVELMKTADMNI
jgi:hypothetical protein